MRNVMLTLNRIDNAPRGAARWARGFTLSLRQTCLGIGILLLGAPAMKAQEVGDYKIEDLRKHFDNVAHGYTIAGGGVELTLLDQPLMNWKNIDKGRSLDRGSIFLWHRNGVPGVIGSIFTYVYRDEVRCRHEMISVADGPLTASLNSRVVWTPQRPGLKWTRLDDVPPPAETSNRRRLQFRGIARQFSGELQIIERPVTRLTLIPNPLHQYQPVDRAGASDRGESKLLEGAIFSFASGTDPEMLLLLESRRAADGTHAFYYAPARSHYQNLKLFRNDVMVWEAPLDLPLQMTRAGEMPYATQPFFVMTPHDPLPTPEEIR